MTVFWIILGSGVAFILLVVFGLICWAMLDERS